MGQPLRPQPADHRARGPAARIPLQRPGPLDLPGHRAHSASAPDGADAAVVAVRVRSMPDHLRRAEGYHQRFGLVHVDFATQLRTPKASYLWYRDLIVNQQLYRPK
ncbi:family 1 glycosylhydrolase [Kitasatospora sp. NPDC051164]|uniref:family 1 glycosylhydrolase n=1 Tax=Kitasatospora sp. NPDC051164 TaxID=3364055 RepID=UPI00379A2940